MIGKAEIIAWILIALGLLALVLLAIGCDESPGVEADVVSGPHAYISSDDPNDWAGVIDVKPYFSYDSYEGPYESRFNALEERIEKLEERQKEDSAE